VCAQRGRTRETSPRLIPPTPHPPFTPPRSLTKLEAGLARATNTQHVFMKNQLSFAVCAICYYLVGFGLTFGEGPLANAFVGSEAFALHNIKRAFVWFIQFAFAINATTAWHGAVSGRMRFMAYLVATAAMSTFVYPIAAHWIWSPIGWLYTLGESGVIDFAGGGPVHIIGGATGLVGSWIIGPRLVGRGQGGNGAKFIHAHNKPLAATGMATLFVGWIAYTTVTGASISMYYQAEVAGRVATVTVLAASSAALVSFAARRALSASYDIIWLSNSMIAGLVSITAPCACIETWAAILIGGVGAGLQAGASGLVYRLGLDDPLDAIAIHLVCGVWSVIAPGFFASPSFIAQTKGIDVGDVTVYGIFYGGSAKCLGQQLLAAAAMAGWALATMTPVFFLLKATSRLRISKEAEIGGVDLFKYTSLAYPDFALGVPFQGGNGRGGGGEEGGGGSGEGGGRGPRGGGGGGGGNAGGAGAVGSRRGTSPASEPAPRSHARGQSRREPAGGTGRGAGGAVARGRGGAGGGGSGKGNGAVDADDDQHDRTVRGAMYGGTERGGGWDGQDGGEDVITSLPFDDDEAGAVAAAAAPAPSPSALQRRPAPAAAPTESAVALSVSAAAPLPLPRSRWSALVDLFRGPQDADAAAPPVPPSAPTAPIPPVSTHGKRKGPAAAAPPVPATATADSRPRSGVELGVARTAVVAAPVVARPVQPAKAAAAAAAAAVEAAAASAAKAVRRTSNASHRPREAIGAAFAVADRGVATSSGRIGGAEGDRRAARARRAKGGPPSAIAAEEERGVYAGLGATGGGEEWGQEGQPAYGGGGGGGGGGDDDDDAWAANLGGGGGGGEEESLGEDWATSVSARYERQQQTADAEATRERHLRAQYEEQQRYYRQRLEQQQQIAAYLHLQREEEEARLRRRQLQLQQQHAQQQQQLQQQQLQQQQLEQQRVGRRGEDDEEERAGGGGAVEPVVQVRAHSPTNAHMQRDGQRDAEAAAASPGGGAAVSAAAAVGGAAASAVAPAGRRRPPVAVEVAVPPWDELPSGFAAAAAPPGAYGWMGPFGGAGPASWGSGGDDGGYSGPQPSLASPYTAMPPPWAALGISPAAVRAHLQQLQMSMAEARMTRAAGGGGGFTASDYPSPPDGNIGGPVYPLVPAPATAPAHVEGNGGGMEEEDDGKRAGLPTG
jgi:ammonium transporter, Amt family